MDPTTERTLRLRHLAQIKTLKTDAPTGKQPTKPVDRHTTPAWAQSATNQVMAQVHAAQSVGAHAKKGELDLNVSVFTFLESATIYLRDVSLLPQIAAAARGGDDEHALQLLRSSDAPIQAIANSWNMDYMTVCDLVDEHAEGNWWYDGPYCGVFVSRDTEKPFAGLAFKGTVTTSLGELLVDVAFEPVQSTAVALPNVHVSKGVYSTLFEPFSALNGAAPFDYILEQLRTLFGSRPSRYELHFTGHSLGASYATLAYAGLLNTIHTGGPSTLTSANLALGDLYTFGSPRLGLTDFARAFGERMAEHAGSAWRVVNDADPITRVPPSPLQLGTVLHPFNHVDSGVRVFAAKAPERIASEVGTHPTPFALPLDFPEHLIPSYFASLYFSANGVAPKSS